MKSEDLIQLIPNAFPDEMCDDLIQYHEWAEGNQLTHTGSVSSLHNPNPDAKPEVLEPKISIDCRYEVHGAPDNINFINAELIKHFQEYCKSYNHKDYNLTDTIHAFPRLNYDCFQIQKYLKGIGHFIGWHLDAGEYDFPFRIREYVYTLYLNDVEDGGETEFLYYPKCNVKPKKGSLLWFPVHFPYVHRGNIPLSGDKYIMTGWVCRAKPEDALQQYQNEKLQKRNSE
jgi:hypothetical protein